MDELVVAEVFAVEGHGRLKKFKEFNRFKRLGSKVSFVVRINRGR
jgi:hypothetical protein